MEATEDRASPRLLETRTVRIGFLLVGIIIAVTAVSYALNGTFRYQWLIYAAAAGFIGLAVLALVWPRAYGRGHAEAPTGKLRAALLISMPVAFIAGSQICGVGLAACGAICHATNGALVVLAAIVSWRVMRSQRVGPLLAAIVVLSLVPHCVCHAPINVVWHSFPGVSPACDAVPLAATLFAVTALRGVRPRASSVIALATLGLIVFIAAGNSILGFPWQGCVS